MRIGSKCFGSIVKGAIAVTKSEVDVPRRWLSCFEDVLADLRDAPASTAHGSGVTVWAWTVDDPTELARLDAAVVDAVITNDPRLFRSVATLRA